MNIKYEYIKLSKENIGNAGVGDIIWDEIISIKILPPQQVYDLSIEGTRNFIANDIIAHNTYLATSSGNVGIGTTSSNYKLDVSGNFSINGNVIKTSGSKTLTAGANTTLFNVSAGGSDLEDLAIFIRYALMQNQGGTLKYEYGNAAMGYRADATGGAISQAAKSGNASIGPPIIDFYGGGNKAIVTY